MGFSLYKNCIFLHTCMNEWKVINMGYKNKKSLILLVKEQLDSKLAIGQNKHAAKAAGTYKEHIYSWGTYKTYLQQCCQFVRWCKQQARQDGSRQPRTLEDCRQYVARYLQHLQQAEYSAYTQKLVLSALCKLYDEYPTTEGRPFGLPDAQTKRHRADITRSRDTVTRDAHFSEEKNRNIVMFCCCTGLRRAELQQIRGIDLDGSSLMVYRGTKGGRVRIVPIVGSANEIAAIQQMAAAAGNSKMFPHVSSAMDVHHYRSVYCKRIYLQYARPADQVPPTDRYYCRQDKKGIVYDKRAMLQASRALGHNRISIIAGHYLQHQE